MNNSNRKSTFSEAKEVHKVRWIEINMLKELGHYWSDIFALALQDVIRLLPQGNLQLTLQVLFSHWPGPSLHRIPRSWSPTWAGTLGILFLPPHLFSCYSWEITSTCRGKNHLWKNVYGFGVLLWDLRVVFRFTSGGGASRTVKSSTGKGVLSTGGTTGPSPEQKDADLCFRC